MKVLILMGSPRPNKNTYELCKPFIKALKRNNTEVEYIHIADKNIMTCKGCSACQQVTGEYGCVQKDDMYHIVESVIWADCIVLATPIYSWYCTPEMKSVLDRYYGLNKYYGKARGSLWEGKSVAIIATHGYEREYATKPFEMGVKNLCNHSKLKYIGMYSVRDVENLKSFHSEEAINGAESFAMSLFV